jgi:hypothetical protein
LSVKWSGFDESHPAQNPKDYWGVSLYLVFLDHLVSEISNRVISNEERFLASYLSPVKHQSLTLDIVDRVFAALNDLSLVAEVTGIVSKMVRIR